MAILKVVCVWYESVIDCWVIYLEFKMFDPLYLEFLLVYCSFYQREGKCFKLDKLGLKLLKII